MAQTAELPAEARSFFFVFDSQQAEARSWSPGGEGRGLLMDEVRRGASIYEITYTSS